MATDRPISEYEGALFDAVLALGLTLLESGNLNESALLDKLSAARSNAESLGNKNGAATLGYLIKFLAEPPVYYRPSELPKS